MCDGYRVAIKGCESYVQNINADANRNQMAFQSKADHPSTAHADTLFCFYDLDLDLDPMTLMYKLDLMILKLYLLTKHELSRSRLSKVST